MNSLIKFIFSLLVALIFSIILCTILPGVKEYIFSDNTKTYTDNQGVTISFNKAEIVDACDKTKSKCLKDVVLIHGKIDKSTVSSFYNLYSVRKVKTVCFHSEGGLNNYAQELMAFIKDKEINTCLAERYHFKDKGVLSNVYCDSACPFVLLMGKERYQIGSDFEIGIHNSGIKLDFCIHCLYINIDASEYRELLTNDKHIKLYDRSIETPFSGVESIPANLWTSYDIFTTAL